MQYVFETLNYRIYEWKRDSLNQPSANAAKRLGLVYESTFRRAAIYKGRSRDTAWLALLEEDYLAMKPMFAHWLAPENFDENRKQIQALGDC